MDWNVWGPPIAVTLLALASGGFFAYTSKGEQPDPEQEKAELLARKQQLMEQLRELEADASKMKKEVFVGKKQELVQLAAQVLQQLEQGPSTPQVSEKTEKKKSLYTIVMIPVTVLFFVLLGVLLYMNSAPRQEGQVMTGGMGGATGPMAEAATARQDRIKSAKQVLEKNPKDLQALNILTYDALMGRDVQSAMKHLEKSRVIDAKNPDVMLHLGILQLSVGMKDKALANFNQVIEQHPNMYRALLWRSLLYANSKENKKALIDAKKADGKLQLIEEQYFLSTIINSLDKPPPIIQGEIHAPDTAKPPLASVLFVIVRRAKEGGGPPVAVVRLKPKAFPQRFELGKGDMVMGGNWPEEVWLEARLDMDGNAMTKSDKDWESGRLGPYQGKQDALQIDLKVGSQSATKTASNNASESTGQPPLKGTIALLDSAAKPKSGTLFIIARRSSTKSGPPAAVKRMVNPTFPVQFSLDETNLMLGGKWPEKVWLEARLDMDGNAMTKSDEDWLTSQVGPLKPNAGLQQLILRPQK